MTDNNYENRLGDALESALSNGASDLAALSDALNTAHCHAANGQAWTGETLAAEFEQLAANTGNWGSGGISYPNDARRTTPPIRMPLSSEDILRTGVLNQWYMICRASDVGAKPVRMTRLNRDIALWRSADGSVNAVDDFCPHRGARLSMGHIVPDGLACSYHGLTVNGRGIVVSVPPVEACPMVGKRKVVSYPAHEAAGSIFLYVSDGLGGEVPELQLPDEMTSNEWSGFLYAEEWDCNYLRVLDNRLDPMHASFLHTETFTLSYGVKQSTIKLETTPRGFIIERDNQRGVNIDRTECVYRPGNNYWIQTDIPYPKSVGGNFFRILGHVTPIDANHSYVFFFRAQKSSGWRRNLWRSLYKNRIEERHRHVVVQDREIMEGIPPDTAGRETLIQCDIGVARLRHMMKREAEQQAERLRVHHTRRAAE